MYRQRFGLTSHPLPKDVRGKAFCPDLPGYRRLATLFQQLLEERGLAVLTGEAGTGKTAAVRQLCQQLPSPQHRVLYLCDTAVSPLDLYRGLAQELGLVPSHRRGQLWTDLKKTLLHLVDEGGTLPVLVLDEAHHLSDRFLIDLSGFLNFAFDSRDLMAVWLVGLSPLRGTLQMQQHAALAMRIAAQVHLEPLPREAFATLIDHGLKAAGATTHLLSDPARELLFRASRGLPRVGAKVLRAALRQAHQQDQSFVDDHTMEQAIEDLGFAVGAVN
jgi:type II secretory pathway predicted ATPase ExeA